MGITCHWVDHEPNLQKRVIAFRVFDERHIAFNIYRLIKIIVEEYGLINKIFAIGFNNAYDNTAFILESGKVCKPTFRGKFFHLKMCLHILNLCVQDDLKQLVDYIKPIRHAFHYLWTHTSNERLGKIM